MDIDLKNDCPSQDFVLEVKGLSLKNGRFKLENINFSLQPGYIYAIAGSNGAGKTTLLKTIMGERKIKKGTIIFEGQDIRKNRVAAMQNIGFISEDVQFFDKMSARQNVEILSTLYPVFDSEIFRKSMNTMKVSMGTNYMDLSKGEKMKFQLAFAMAHKSRMYILDEATAGLDPVFRIDFFNTLRRLLMEGCCVLMTTHNISEIRKQTDYAAIMADGRLDQFMESLEM